MHLSPEDKLMLISAKIYSSSEDLDVINNLIVHIIEWHGFVKRIIENGLAPLLYILKMIQAVNEIEPDVLFIGMTAPKQEKWAYHHFKALNTGHVCCIWAVFDFYAGTVNRAPQWMIKLGLEWFYRLVREPKRMWRRYLIGNVKFILLVVKEKFMNFLNCP